VSARRKRKRVEIGAPVLARNDEIAAANRARFERSDLYVINLISSPGSGKTSLLERMAGVLGPQMAVIVGDLQTRRDAERVLAAGCAAVQIETDGACHLNAEAVAGAFERLAPPRGTCRLLVIENVGNLVCPASFDLGEHMKVALLSVPEGDDKVLKYPSIFSRVGALLIGKVDLLRHLEFDVDRAVRECAGINDRFDVFRVSAKTGEGVEDFCRYLLEKRSESRA